MKSTLFVHNFLFHLAFPTSSVGRIWKICSEEKSASSPSLSCLMTRAASLAVVASWSSKVLKVLQLLLTRWTATSWTAGILSWRKILETSATNTAEWFLRTPGTAMVAAEAEAETAVVVPIQIIAAGTIVMTIECNFFYNFLIDSRKVVHSVGDVPLPSDSVASLTNDFSESSFLNQI